ncbi:hypothetical protein J1N35_019467 [Gossypium stocksii]|uniref:Retrotransposon gag domain-containing protein n=1 Tax=Gossypium stocksii TaxID=47602 RepID=A0A9D3VSZ5_9ROSI|nr:hypothetical protein J1N35_019467 [Gossypium stocksii]
MAEAPSDYMDTITRVLNTLVGELIEKEDAPEAMVWALKEEIEELNEELNIYKATLENRVLVVAPMPKVDVLKPKEFNGTRFANDVDNFLRRINGIVGPRMKDNVFYPENVKDEARAKLYQFTQQCTIKEYVKKFSELILQIFNLSDNTFFPFMDGLKPLVKQELEHRVKELSKKMTVEKSLFKLFLRKNKIKSFEPKEKGNSGGDEKGQGKNDNNNVVMGDHLTDSGSPTINQRAGEMLLL